MPGCCQLRTPFTCCLGVSVAPHVTTVRCMSCIVRVVYSIAAFIQALCWRFVSVNLLICEWHVEIIKKFFLHLLLTVQVIRFQVAPPSRPLPAPSLFPTNTMRLEWFIKAWLDGCSDRISAAAQILKGIMVIELHKKNKNMTKYILRPHRHVHRYFSTLIFSP